MRVNPSHIQAYRSMAVQIQPGPSEGQRFDRAHAAASTGRNKLEIEGSTFANLLSKAEREFIIEKFSESSSPSGHTAGESRGRTRGVYLDVKA